jgi:hypothetical protein
MTITRPAASAVKLLAGLLLASTLLPACAPNYSEYELRALHASSGTARDQGWTARGISGLHLSLLSPGRTEEMNFEPGGRVTVRGGLRHGSTSGGVYRWKLIGTELHVFDADGHFYDVFTPVRRGPYTIKLRRHDGAIAVYRIRQ